MAKPIFQRFYIIFDTGSAYRYSLTATPNALSEYLYALRGSVYFSRRLNISLSYYLLCSRAPKNKTDQIIELSKSKMPINDKLAKRSNI